MNRYKVTYFDADKGRFESREFKEPDKAMEFYLKKANEWPWGRADARR